MAKDVRSLLLSVLIIAALTAVCILLPLATRKGHGPSLIPEPQKTIWAR